MRETEKFNIGSSTLTIITNTQLYYNELLLGIFFILIIVYNSISLLHF